MNLNGRDILAGVIMLIVTSVVSWTGLTVNQTQITVAGFAERFESLDNQIVKLEGRLTSLRKELSEMRTRLSDSAIDHYRIGRLEREIEQHKEALFRLRQEKQDREEDNG